MVSSGYGLKLDPIRFAGRLDMWCKRKRGVKNESKVFDLSEE